MFALVSNELHAAGVVQRWWRRKKRDILLEHHEFTKWLDPASGHYYYVKRDDPEYTTWAKPRGDVPLQPMDPDEARTMRKERAKAAAVKVKKKYERARLIDIVRQKHVEAERKRRADEKQQEIHDYNDLWRRSIDFAEKNHMELNVNYRHQTTIHPDVLSGKPFRALRLVGNDFVQLPNLTALKGTLIHLSVPANKLTKLPDSICELGCLQSLNLTRNQLTSLPAKFGDLGKCLEELHIATNHLESLPITIGNLSKLTRLVLDCNRLRRLPETLRNLEKCSHLSVNANRLVSLPRCLALMPRLKSLSANGNKLRQLPQSLGESTTLERLSVCANLLSDIPESLCHLTETLTELWVDHNTSLTSLPWNMFTLRNLLKLHVDGCINMIFPNRDVCDLGAAAVKEWFRKRQKHNLFVRRHRIVTTFQDILEQIVETKPAVMSQAYFEPDVNHEDELWYAVIMDQFWTSGLSALKDCWDEGRYKKGRVSSLPYSRDEVDKVLQTYTDAEGTILLQNVTTRFRKCACVDEEGNRRVCVPPAPGYMCERSATLIKMHIVLQRERVERERRRRETVSVEQAIEAARADARDFANSEEGQALFYVKARKQAAKEMQRRRQQRQANAQDRKFDAAARKLKATFEKKRDALKEQARVHEERLYDRLHNELEPAEDRLDGYAKEKVTREIDDLVKTLSDLPEEQQLRDLEKAHQEDLAKVKEKLTEIPTTTTTKGRSLLGGLNVLEQRRDAKEEEELIEELEIDFVNKYTAKQAAKAEKHVRDEHGKMRKIAASWAGLTVYDVFKNWRKHTKKEKKRRAKDQWASRADELQQAADLAAAVELAKFNLRKYEAFVDVWSDLPYWRHQDTGAVVWEEPLLRDLLPPGMSIPDEFLNDDDLCQQTLEAQALAVVSPGGEEPEDDSDAAAAAAEEDLSSSSSEDSDDDTDDDDSEEGSEEEDSVKPEEEPETTEHGLVVKENDFVGVIDDDDLSDDEKERLGLDETESETSSEARELLEWDKDDAVLPPVRDKLPPLVPEKKVNELEQARERAALRRKRAIAKYNEEPVVAKPTTTMLNRLSNAAKDILGGGGGGEETQVDDINDVGGQVGFDASREYTQVELTVMARRAHKYKKSHGIRENLDGAFEKNILQKGIAQLTSRSKKGPSPGAATPTKPK